MAPVSFFCPSQAMRTGAKDSQGFAMLEDRSLNEVLIECVTAAGGSKLVGAKLWPEKLVDHAQRALLDALNDDRPHNLKPDQVLMVAELARAAGCHAFMTHCAGRLHYLAPVPREPADELADLQRAFVAAMAELPKLAAQIQSLQAQVAPAVLKAVA
jgi:hypothetical protein